MSKSTLPKPTTTKKPDEINTSSDNATLGRGSATPQNSTGTRLSLRPK